MSEIKTCRYCEKPALTRRNGVTCGGEDCQAERMRETNRQRYATDPKMRRLQRENVIKNYPSVAHRMRVLMKELIEDPVIGKQGALKTLSVAMWGPDRFVSPATALKRKRAQ